MKHRVNVTPEARADLFRLNLFLANQSPTAARRAMDAIDAGLRSLARMPARARRTSDDLHTFPIRFGQSGYLVQFRVMDDTVVIARIHHMREDRPAADA
ncbi:MAG: type II toxin-antitoxin system RelE/ParE family toxin [Brevundimonas sp.]